VRPTRKSEVRQACRKDTAQLDALKAAYARGERSVTFGDRTTVYRSESEMRQAIATIEASIGQATRPKQFHGYHRGKGLL